jgi:hypothetical protein
MRPAIAIIIALALPVLGCVLPGEITPTKRLTDLRFVSVETGNDPNSLTVLFTVTGDLRALSQEHARFIHMNVWPCRQSSRYLALMPDPKIYDAVGAIAPRSAGFSAGKVYRFQMPLEARTLKDAPSYDLRTAVEDICFSISGAGPGLLYDPAYNVFSNPGVLPAGETSKAISIRR